MTLLWIELIIFFLIGYGAIIFEQFLNFNKAATALLMAAGCWIIYFFFQRQGHPVETLAHHLSDIAQIIFFLLSAMTIVEIIDSHHGFKLVTDILRTNSKRKMLWSILFLSFFMSAVLDNLTTMIVMTSLLRKMIPEKKERWLLGSLVVISVNAGGAWTPIGDVTTTMMWIKGTITSLQTMKWLFLPSLVCMVISGLIAMIYMRGKYVGLHKESENRPMEPGGKTIFFIGLLVLILVPVWKGLLNVPPFMGAMIGLGVLWLVTDLMHFRHAEQRKHLRMTQVLARIDTSAILFFLGILLAISALTSAGILEALANFLERTLPNQHYVAIVIGLISSIIDNVPLVAATFGMYDLATYPVDSSLWQMIAYAAGTGGSILIIGSAAGVAFMGMEGVSFIWYLKKVSWIALVGYFAGIVVYFLQEFAIR